MLSGGRRVSDVGFGVGGDLGRVTWPMGLRSVMEYVAHVDLSPDSKL
jgi:hypothetical protein